MKNPLLDSELHAIEIVSGDEKIAVYIDGVKVKDAETRLFVLGSAIFSAEIIPQKLWKS